MDDWGGLLVHGVLHRTFHRSIKLGRVTAEASACGHRGCGGLDLSETLQLCGRGSVQNPLFLGIESLLWHGLPTGHTAETFGRRGSTVGRPCHNGTVLQRRWAVLLVNNIRDFQWTLVASIPCGERAGRLRAHWRDYGTYVYHTGTRISRPVLGPSDLSVGCAVSMHRSM